MVYGGSKNSGKSYLGCSVIGSSALIYPETHYFIARKKLNDLRKYTTPSMYEVFQHWNINPEYYKFNGDKNPVLQEIIKHTDDKLHELEDYGPISSSYRTQINEINLRKYLTDRNMKERINKILGSTEVRPLIRIAQFNILDYTLLFR